MLHYFVTFVVEFSLPRLNVEFMADNKGTAVGAEDIIDFGPVHDTTKNIIKVVGVGGGGCNAVGNMFVDGMDSVTFAVCNTDSKSLSVNPVPTKIMLGRSGHGAGANPQRGREEAEQNMGQLRELFSDNTEMVFVVATMGGGTGTGAGPLVAQVAREAGLLTVGIVTLPFYFEKRPKIIKALKGIEDMRANVDALLIINNQQITRVYSDSRIPVDDAFKKADEVMGNAVRSISELITLSGKIQTDFSDVCSTMRNGGGAIMAIGRSSGDHRVQRAVLDALDSPLLYGTDISKATRILFNIYTSKEHQLYVNELEEIDAFMDELAPDIEVIWGLATDDTLGEDAKITILATGFDNSLRIGRDKVDRDGDIDEVIRVLYDRTPKPLRGLGESPQRPVAVPAAEEDEEEEDENGQETPMPPTPPSPSNDPAKDFLKRVIARIKEGWNIIVAPDDV